MQNILAVVESARPYYSSIPMLAGSPDIQELKEKGQRLKEAGAMLSERKHEMLGEHKQECFSRIQEVRASQDAWWQQVSWQRAQRRADAQARIRANLERNYERHQKATAALSRLRENASDLRYKIDSAWNESWKSTAYGWLSEMEAKISDIESSISRIEEWIREDEAKL